MRFFIKFIFFYHITINFYYVVCPTVTCDFDIDACDWTLDSTWLLYPSGSTPDTSSSGPIADHTTGTGNYARFMGSRLNDSNQFGIINTRVSLEQPTSFSFWYFMHGTQIGTLALVVNQQTIWEKRGRQGIPLWYQANVTLSAGFDLNIAFLANRTGIGRSSDIAIDDIILQGEPMPSSTRTPKPPSTTTPRTRYNASCDFDVDRELCGWKSDTKYGWKVIGDREPNITIGPSSDYSSIMRPTTDGKFCQIPYTDSGTQYYCVMNKNTKQCKGSDGKWLNCRDGGFVQIRTGVFDEVGERSQFDSPVLDALTDKGCIQFHYNIAGTDDDWLNVYVEDYWTDQQTCMWHKNGASVPDRWTIAEAPLQLEKDGRYRIVFEARKGKTGGMGLVSIDHIIVSSQPCSGSYPVEECPYEETTTTTISTTTTSTTATSTTTTSTTEAILSTSTTSSTTTSSEFIFSTTTFTVSTVSMTSTTTAMTTTTSTGVITDHSIITDVSGMTTIVGTSGEPDATTDTVASSSTYTPVLTVTSTSMKPVEDTTRKESPEKKSKVTGIVVGVLVPLFIISVVIIVHLNRRKLRKRFSTNRSQASDIIPAYRAVTSSDGFILLDNSRDVETFA